MNKNLLLSKIADKILLSGLWIFTVSLLLTKSGLDTSVALITFGAAIKFFVNPADCLRRLPPAVKNFFMFAGVFLVIELAGIFISTDVFSSIKRWVIHLGYFGLFVGMFFIKSPSDNITKFARCISIISVAVAIVAVFQHFYCYDFPRGRHSEFVDSSRAMGTLSSPNDLGILLGVLLPFMLSIFLQSRVFKEKIIFALGFWAGLFALVLTFTRGAWMGAFVGVSAMFLVKKDKRKFLWLSAVFVVVLFAVFAPARNRLMYALRQGGLDSTRTFFLKNVPLMIMERPLLGHGPDTFKKNFYDRYPDFPDQGHFHPHNIYLNIAYQTGLVGLFVWLAMFYSVFSFLWRILKERPSVDSDGKTSFAAAVSWGAFGSLISFFVHGFIDETFRAYQGPYGLFFILGAAISTWQASQHEDSDWKNL